LLYGYEFVIAQHANSLIILHIVAAGIEMRAVTVREHKGWVRNVALIKCTLGPAKPKKGWNFGGEGTGARWGTRGVSLQATWD
jgi:hypothetical protein